MGTFLNLLVAILGAGVVILSFIALFEGKDRVGFALLIVSACLITAGLVGTILDLAYA
jgi:hypothetical protein